MPCGSLCVIFGADDTVTEIQLNADIADEEMDR